MTAERENWLTNSWDPLTLEVLANRLRRGIVQPASLTNDEAQALDLLRRAFEEPPRPHRDSQETPIERIRRERAEAEAAGPAAQPATIEHDADLIPEIEESYERTEADLEIDRIIDGVDIVEAYRRWCGKMEPKIGRKREGVMISCPKPDHRDANPSAWLNLDDDVWFCGGCQEGGDKFDIAAYHFGYDVPGYKQGKAFVDLRHDMATDVAGPLPSAATAPPAGRLVAIAGRGTPTPLASGDAAPGLAAVGARASALPELNSDALHGLAGEVVRTIAPTTEASPAAILFQFLIAFGNAIGRGPFCVVEETRHYFNLYGVLVGQSSKGRKGTSWRRVAALFRDVDPWWLDNCVKDGLTSGEGLVHHVRDKRVGKPPAKRASGSGDDAGEVVLDEGALDKRLLCQEGEFVAVLQNSRREGNPLTARLRQAWDTGDLNTLTKTSPDTAKGAHISIVGHITRDDLVQFLNAVEMANGFANRFLWIVVDRAQLLPFGGTFDPVVRDALVEKISLAQEFARGAGRIDWADDARALWREVYEELSEGHPGLVGSVTNRAEAQVLRLAGLYAVLDQKHSIGRRHLEAALAAWCYCEQSAAAIWGTRSGRPLADRIHDMLVDAGAAGLTRAEISSGLHRKAAKADIDRALDQLKADAKVQSSEDSSTGGRRAQRWRAV